MPNVTDPSQTWRTRSESWAKNAIATQLATLVMQGNADRAGVILLSAASTALGWDFRAEETRRHEEAAAAALRRRQDIDRQVRTETGIPLTEGERAQRETDAAARRIFSAKPYVDAFYGNARGDRGK